MDKEKIVDIREAAYGLERKMNTDQNVDFPTPVEFLLKVPLYKSFKANESNWQKVEEIVCLKIPIDTYCVECKKSSTFCCNKSYIKLS